MHEGREQGADMGAETVYVREFDGETQERRAYTPADVVNLEARGWKPKDRQPKTAGRGSSSPRPAGKSAAAAADENA